MTTTRALLALVVVFVGRVGWAGDYSDIVVFGDSLSDGGNAAVAILGGLPPGVDPTPFFEDDQFTSPPDTDLVPGAPYVLTDAPTPADFLAARFTNGPVWVERLAAGMGMVLLPSFGGGTNYAFGGANTGPLPPEVEPNGVPTLQLQTQLYLFDNGFVADPEALYVVLGGGNDVLDGVVLGDPQLILNVLRASAHNIAGILESLHAAGARHFLVGLVPNVGLTPQAQAAGLGDQATAASAFLSLLYTGKIARFKRRTDADVRVLNAFGLLTRYVKRPARYGFTNPTDPCVSFLPPCTSFADPDEYVFWDGIHPTTRTHKLVSDAAARILRRRRR